MKTVAIIAAFVLSACGGAESMCGQQCVGSAEGPYGAEVTDMTLTGPDGGVLDYPLRKCTCVDAKRLSVFVFPVFLDDDFCAAQRSQWEDFRAANCN